MSNKFGYLTVVDHPSTRSPSSAPTRRFSSSAPFPLNWLKSDAVVLALSRGAKLLLVLALAWEAYFLHENGLDTCGWLLSTGYLKHQAAAGSGRWKHSQAQLEKLRHGRHESPLWSTEYRWQPRGCSLAVYTPNMVNLAKECFRRLAPAGAGGEKFTMGFAGDHWIRDLFNFLSIFVNDSASAPKWTFLDDGSRYSMRFESSELDAVFHWLPYMNKPRLFDAAAIEKFNLGNWSPQVVLAGAGLWTMLKSDGMAYHRYRDHSDYIRTFAEDAATHPERTTLWKLIPPYFSNSKFAEHPRDLAYDLLKVGVDYYNEGALKSLQEVPSPTVHVWSVDAKILESMAANERVAYVDWKHFSNETLLYEAQILLNFLCNGVTDDGGSCCSTNGLFVYLTLSPAFLVFWMYFFGRIFSFHVVFMKIFKHALRLRAGKRVL